MSAICSSTSKWEIVKLWRLIHLFDPIVVKETIHETSPPKEWVGVKGGPPVVGVGGCDPGRNFSWTGSYIKFVFNFFMGKFFVRVSRFGFINSFRLTK